MLIGFLPNKESISAGKSNALSFFRLARSLVNQAEMPVRCLSGNLFIYKGDVLPHFCNTVGGANKTLLVNLVSVEGAPDSSGGRESQAGSEESNGASFGS